MSDHRYTLDTPLTPPPPARRAPRRLLAAGAVVVLAAAGGGIWVGSASSSGPQGYRTASVTRQDVQQTVQSAGTIEPVAEATVAFPMAGTVNGVAVQLGQNVSVGQPLATLDTTSLNTTLTTANATLANAQLTLQNALAGVSTPSAGGGGSGGGGGGGGFGSSVQAQSAGPAQAAAITDDPPPSSTPAPGGTPSGPLASDESAVLAAQKTVDGDLQTAKAALAAAATACASSTTGSGGSGSGATTTTPPGSGGAGGTGATSAACSQALANAFDAEQTLASAQQALSAAANTFTADLAKAESAASGQGSSGQGSSGQGSSGRGSSTRSSVGTASSGSGRSFTGTSSATSSAPSAADLIADQAAVDAAQLQVAVAQQAISQATLVSPIAGTVAAVALAPGQKVGAASSTADVVVEGTGGYEVATTVTVDQVAQLSVGAPAVVAPDGTGETLHAKVVSIGVNPTATSTATTYPVVLGLDDAAGGLRNGATASVTITLRGSTSALAVPTSAVQTLGGRTVVSVLTDGKATPAAVTVGAIGDQYVAITSGLQAGQTVVLADLSAPLPSSDNATNTVPGLQNVTVAQLRQAFGGGGFGGGGGRGGGGGGRGGGG